MAGFHLLDPRRLELDARRIVGDSRQWCTVYRRGAGETVDTFIGSFWGRISNIGHQTTGLERALQAARVTGALWVLRAPPEAPAMIHGDEIRTEDGTRWRVVLNRSLPGGQVAIISNLQ
jgi:hypothetical protein